MCGVGPIGSTLEDIKMSPMLHDYKYCARIIGGFQHFKPDVHVFLNDAKEVKDFECIYTNFVDDIHQQLNGIFFIQNAYNYPCTGKCLYQVWKPLKSVTIYDINTFWNE